MLRIIRNVIEELNRKHHWLFKSATNIQELYAILFFISIMDGKKGLEKDDKDNQINKTIFCMKKKHTD